MFSVFVDIVFYTVKVRCFRHTLFLTPISRNKATSITSWYELKYDDKQNQ